MRGLARLAQRTGHPYNLLNRELLTMNSFNLWAFDDVAARWPPPVARLKLFVQRLSGTGARLD